MTTWKPDQHDTRYKNDEDKRCANCLALFEDHHNGECPEDESNGEDDEQYMQGM